MDVRFRLRSNTPQSSFGDLAFIPCPHSCTTIPDLTAWQASTALRQQLLTLIIHPNDGVKINIARYYHSVILTQSPRAETSVVCFSVLPWVKIERGITIWSSFDTDNRERRHIRRYSPTHSPFPQTRRTDSWSGDVVAADDCCFDYSHCVRTYFPTMIVRFCPDDNIPKCFQSFM